MNELTYSFIGALRAWLRENELCFHENEIKVTMSAYTFHYGIRAQFDSDRFEAGFFIWEKCNRDKAMSDIEFADWRKSLQGPDYQLEFTHIMSMQQSVRCETHWTH